MAPNSTPDSVKTFCITSSVDLLEKLRLEANILWSGKCPEDLRTRAYLIMNCAITAWQLKDWVFEDLHHANRLEALYKLAGKRIKDAGDFGKWLCSESREMAMCYQIATAAKHFTVNHRPDSSIYTHIETKPKLFGDGLWTEMYIVDDDEMMSAPDLLIWVCLLWDTWFLKLGLTMPDKNTSVTR